jgi:hypothetical protein
LNDAGAVGPVECTAIGGRELGLATGRVELAALKSTRRRERSVAYKVGAQLHTSGRYVVVAAYAPEASGAACVAIVDGLLQICARYGQAVLKTMDSPKSYKSKDCEISLGRASKER